MSREGAAKFFAGFAANQVPTHGAFATMDAQFTTFGIGYAQQFNTAAVVFRAVASALLVHRARVRECVRPLNRRRRLRKKVMRDRNNF